MQQKTSLPIFITGVGKRLGLGLAQHFLANGIPVIGTYRTEYPVLKTLEEQGAELYQCDFYNQLSVDSLIELVARKYPKLRAIIHNASDWIPEKSALVPSEIMSKMMQVHVSVPYQINLALSHLLVCEDQASADIIHLTDYVSDKGSKKHIAYAASKAALSNMTLSFAASFAPGIKVNAIAPALVMFNAADDEAYKHKAVKKALIEKEGGLQEVISAVDYLLLSRYVTGRTMHLDGGRHLK